MAENESIKITQLPSATVTEDGNYLVFSTETNTFKIKVKDFMVQFTQPINKSIADEETSRKTADNLLQKNIDDEVTNRESADTEITNALNKESEERKKADTALQNEIDDLNRFVGHVYGFKREIANSNYLTRITYIDEAIGKTPVTVNLTNQTQDLGSWGDFINKVARPVMVTYGGVVDYELDHNDTTKKLDGSPSDIDNLDYAGNAMVEFRNYRYVSRKTVDGFQYVRFANYKVDDTFEDNAFVNENGVHSLTFYFSMFDGGLVGDKMRSIAGAEILRSKNASQEMTLAKSNGKGWNTGTWSQLNYIWDLLTLLGKTDGLQETFGRGICDFSYNDGVNPFGWIVGQTKNKGCFFGQSGGANPVRTLWIEDLWGRSHDRYAGLINDNGIFKVKLVPPYPTPSDSAGVYSDYINTELVTSANGFVKEANCSEFGFLPQVAGGSTNTYFCDNFYKNDNGVKYVRVGGDYNIGSSCGRCVYVNDVSANTRPNAGSRLSYNV